jgi:heptosyltransferase-2
MISCRKIYCLPLRPINSVRNERKRASSWTVTESTFLLQGPLVVRSPNWLGDAVMALPAVRNIKTMIVDDVLAVAAPQKLAALWEKCPFVDRVIALEKPRNLRQTAKQLRAENFGSTVLFPNSLRSAGEAWRASIPQRIGYGTDSRGLLLTHSIPPPERNPARLHQRFYYLDLVTALGGPSDASLPRLRKDPTTLRGSRGLMIAICPGAEYGPAKRWPVEHFAAVARHFVATRKAEIVLLGAAGDAEVADQFMKRVPTAENRVGKTSLAEFMDALVAARLVVCNDSGAMHVASALGVPTLSIFGSTEPALTGPMGPRSRVMRHHVPCSPCFLRDCPLDFACMGGITPDAAIEAAEQLLR